MSSILIDGSKNCELGIANEDYIAIRDDESPERIKSSNVRRNRGSIETLGLVTKYFLTRWSMDDESMDN